MKICISSQGTTLDSAVDPRFGRCRFFIFADTDTLEFEAIENSNMNGSGGAGIQSGQCMNDNGVAAVLTGNVGPNAFQTLEASGIEIITGVSGTVKEAIESFKQGKYQKTQAATVAPHSGMR